MGNFFILNFFLCIRFPRYFTRRLSQYIFALEHIYYCRVLFLGLFFLLNDKTTISKGTNYYCLRVILHCFLHPVKNYKYSL